MTSDEEELERRADFIIRELDEFCALATNPETSRLLHSQRILIGQIHTRVSLILSYLLSQKQVTNGETIKRNHGVYVAAQDRQ